MRNNNFTFFNDSKLLIEVLLMLYIIYGNHGGKGYGMV